ncbi:TPA: hypothetical protein ACH3X2_009239 [Trebouxia sp. C0005]
MLDNPNTDPISIFAPHFSARQIGRPTSMVRAVMQAQMTGLLLSLILQLALADSNSLTQHIYNAGGLSLLHNLAMDCTDLIHPETEAAGSIRLLHPDVHAKLAQLYRLIPLAISCMYEVTGTRDSFMPWIVAVAANAADTSHRMLALQLQDHLKILQQTPLPIGNLIDAANMAQRDRIMRRCVSQDVKSSPYAKHYVGQLQHAGLSLFTPYGSRQSSNCLFWLCEEPESDAEVTTVSEVETFATLINGEGGVSEPHAQVTAEPQPSAPPWDGRDGSDIDEGLNNPDDAEQTPEAINGLSGRSENLSGHTFGDLQNVATEEQRQGRAEDLGGPGCWTTGRVVLLSATAFSAKICVTALESMVDKWAEERRLESLQARGDEMTAGRSR